MFHFSPDFTAHERRWMVCKVFDDWMDSDNKTLRQLAMFTSIASAQGWGNEGAWYPEHNYVITVPLARDDWGLNEGTMRDFTEGFLNIANLTKQTISENYLVEQLVANIYYLPTARKKPYPNSGSPWTIQKDAEYSIEIEKLKQQMTE